MITAFIVGMTVFFVGTILGFFCNAIVAPGVRLSLTVRLEKLRREAILLQTGHIDSAASS